MGHQELVMQQRDPVTASALIGPSANESSLWQTTHAKIGPDSSPSATKEHSSTGMTVEGDHVSVSGSVSSRKEGVNYATLCSGGCTPCGHSASCGRRCTRGDCALDPTCVWLGLHGKGCAGSNKKHAAART